MADNAPHFVDAHHHLWDLQACRYPWLMAKGERRFFGDPSPIQKNYLPGDFLSESAVYRPAKSVHIQVGVAADDALRETAWLQGLPQFPHAIVAFCDLSSPGAAAELAAQQKHSRVRGIRQIIGRHAEEDRKHGSDALLENPAWIMGLRLLAERDLSFDLQMIPPQTDRVLAALCMVPQLRVALCHCGSPWDQSQSGLERWRIGLRRLAELPNLVCKVSGLGMFNPHWRPDQLRPIILEVIEIFGPQRVMFGSNVPVDKLYNSYEALWQAYSEITEGFTLDERADLFHRTAERFYRI